MNNTENTTFQPIISVIRKATAATKTQGKFTLKEDDNPYQVIQKLTKFIAKNSEKPSQEEIIDALAFFYPDATFEAIEEGFTSMTSQGEAIADLDKMQARLKGFSKAVPDSNSAVLFSRTTLNLKDKEVKDLFILSPLAGYTQNQYTFWRNNERNGLAHSQYSRIFLLSLDKLVGQYKVYNLLQSYLSEEPSIFATEESLVELFKHTFCRPEFSSKKKYHYYWTEELQDIMECFYCDESETFSRLVKKEGYTIEIKEGDNARESLMKFKKAGTTYFVYPASDKKRYQLTATIKFVMETISKLYREDKNVQLLNAYAKSAASNYATAFQTKKNIPERIQIAMAQSTFSKDFSFVEFDETVDLDKMRELESEWETYRKVLPHAQNGKMPDLRFRYLGKHKANGIFFPGANSIGVDPRYGIQSFSHEYGHFLDFNNSSEVPLSLQAEFSHILLAYQEGYDCLAEKPAKTGKCSDDYFKTPTEVLARAFEVYVDSFKVVQTSFKKSSLEFSLAHKPFEKIKDEVQHYFDQLFPEMRQAVEVAEARQRQAFSQAASISHTWC
ncbi:hypothetical protein QR692_10195 [Lactococcus petauri]|uniref:LPD1 domain-containing protein n=1 Tax=Lactococcus petauri TaxID=1940789 RepID=UPI0020788591|nr:hypothetical protein [Lactococcus petauri]USI65353.1 hypothetical protein LMK05_11080 [Lactococcus petauri]USI67848.1 hypothetical protein LMK04_10315 [Lactococcus petauri]WJE12509.1 hypothetical protein QR692_10195 [Lactococcus petauri]